MSHTYYRRLAQILGSPTPWVFLIAAVALGLLGEGASKLVDAWFGEQPPILGIVTMMAGFVLLLALLFFFNLPQIMRSIGQTLRPAATREPHSAKTPPVAHRRALIALVSRGDYVPAADALYYHGWDKVPGQAPKLTHCWLITGPDSGEKSSQANAESLKSEYENKGVLVEIWRLRDEYNVAEVYRAARTIYQAARHQYDLELKDIIVDYTGGTKSMTAGLTLAATAVGGDMQFMKPNVFTDGGVADKGAGSQPYPVTVTFVDVTDKVGQEYVEPIV